MHPTGLDDVTAGQDDDETAEHRQRRGSRRALLASVAAGGVTAVAGCLAGGSGGDGPFQEWLGGLSEYDGVVDETGSERVTVAVGAGSDGLAFDPVAVAVDPGTTVVWEWTGAGGRHNVVDRDGAFESNYHTNEGATFEYTFENTGTVEYYCEPHQQLGMRGGVHVR